MFILDHNDTVPLYKQLYKQIRERVLSGEMPANTRLPSVRRMRITCQKKHDAMLGSIERHFGNRAAIFGQGAGLHVVMQLQDENPGETEIIRLAAQNRINLFPFSATRINKTAAATNLLLGFGGMNPAEIEQGIKILSRICS